MTSPNLEKFVNTRNQISPEGDMMLMVQVLAVAATQKLPPEIWTARMQSCSRELWPNQTWEFTPEGQLQVQVYWHISTHIHPTKCVTILSGRILRRVGASHGQNPNNHCNFNLAPVFLHPSTIGCGMKAAGLS